MSFFVLFFFDCQTFWLVAMIDCCNGDAVCYAIFVVAKQTHLSVAVDKSVDSDGFLINFAFFCFFVVFAGGITCAICMAVNRNLFCRASAIFIKFATFTLAFEFVHNYIICFYHGFYTFYCLTEWRDSW